MGQIEQAEAEAVAVRAEISDIEATVQRYAAELSGVNARLSASPDPDLEQRAAALRATIKRLRERIPPNGDHFGDAPLGRRLLDAEARVKHLRQVKLDTAEQIRAAEVLERRWAGRLSVVLAALAGIYGDLLSAGGPAVLASFSALRNDLDRQRAVIDALPALRRSLAELGGSAS